MPRLFIAALACLISVSVFGEVIRVDINYDGELDKTTLITDSINQKSLSIKVSGSPNIIGISIDFEKVYKCCQNRHNHMYRARYFFVKSNYTYIHTDNTEGFLKFEDVGVNIIGIGIGGIRQKSANKFFDYSIGLGAIIDVYSRVDGDLRVEVYPFPIFSLGTRKITKNNNIIKYGVGFPELLHIGYGFSF